MSQRLIKSTGPEQSYRERELWRWCSRAWEKASRFIDCQALELPKGRLPVPIVPLSFTED